MPKKRDLDRTSGPLNGAEAGEALSLDDLRRDPQNRRQHPPRNLEMIAASLRAVGPARSIVIDEVNTLLAGEGVVTAAAAAGLSKVRIIDADGDELIAVRRRGLTEEQKRHLAIFDNRTSELSEWNGAQLSADRDAGLDLRPFWTEEEEAALASAAATDELFGMAAQRVQRTAEEEPAAGGAGDMATFSCPLTVAQERIVRAALRRARVIYSVQTTGDALVAALNAWATQVSTEREHGGEASPGEDVQEAGR